MDNNYENIEKRKVGRPKKQNDNEIKEKRPPGRPKVYSDEEKKERKKKYDIEYQRERYKTDDEFRLKCKNRYYNCKNALQ